MKRAIRVNAEGRMTTRMYELGEIPVADISTSSIQRLSADSSTFIESYIGTPSISIKALKRLLEKSKSHK